MAAARAKPQAQPDLPLQVAEGCHLHMPESVYFGARALGSSDLKALYWDAASWWAASVHNPNRRQPQRMTRAVGKDMGSGLHTLVLEGEDAYTSRFVVEPDSQSNRYARTRQAIIKLLAERGIKIARGDFDMGRLYAHVRRAGIGHLVWDVAYADYEKAKREGRTIITTDEDRRLRYTAHLISRHKELGAAFQGGLSEVSVFWRRPEDPATLLRARFDYLRVRRMYDLKSLGNWSGRDIGAAVARAIEDHDYGIQRRLYAEAWERMAEFVAAGQVHAWAPDGGGSPVRAEERGFLERIAAAGAPEWVWVFVQMPVDDIGHERGAIVAPRWHAPQGRLWDESGRKIEQALDDYRRFRDDRGLAQPWAWVDGLKELTDADLRVRTKKEIE
jgi:hypothetical protein